MIAEVKEYDQYISGEVYGYTVKTLDTKKEIDSCWGFYGNEADNGIYDYVAIENLTEERYKEVFESANWE